MTKEEIENRIIVCEMKANAHREVGNTKTADRYDNERYKWEKLLSDLELLDERKIKELLDYKKGYFDLQQENQKYKEVIDKAIEYTEEHRINNPYHYEYNCFMGNARASDLLDILKEVE